MRQQTKKESNWEVPAAASFGCVGYRVRRLSRVVSAIYDDTFSQLKLKISQFGILMMLSRRGPSSAAELCRLVMMDKSTASRNLWRMRRRGWISVTQNSSGPGQKVSLTSQGAQVLQKAYPLWRKAQDEASRRLRADGLRALELVVTRINE